MGAFAHLEVSATGRGAARPRIGPPAPALPARHRRRGPPGVFKVDPARALPPEHCGDTRRFGERVAGGSFNGCHLSASFQRPFDEPLGQPHIRGRAIGRGGFAIGVEAAVMADRPLIADERVVDEVSDARLVKRADDLREAERRRAGAAGILTDLTDQPPLELVMCRGESLSDDLFGIGTSSRTNSRGSRTTTSCKAGGSALASEAVSCSPALTSRRSQPRSRASRDAAAAARSMNRARLIALPGIALLAGGSAVAAGGPRTDRTGTLVRRLDQLRAQHLNGMSSPRRHSSNRASVRDASTTPARRPSSRSSSRG